VLIHPRLQGGDESAPAGKGVVSYGESMEHIGFYLKKLKIKLNKFPLGPSP
jgi:hypothetical protein